MGSAHTKSVTVRLDVDLNRRLDKWCNDASMSKSLAVNCALAHFLGGSDKSRLELIRGYVVQAKKKGAGR